MEKEVKKAILKVVEKANNNTLTSDDKRTITKLIDYLDFYQNEVGYSADAVELFMALLAVKINQNNE